ncbi:MAG TPA: hypothetical protein VN046_09000 [Stenotrophobium sp.]|jgi:hypothetical protein|nr:hypothetical protein [Stenotrophobium sp.]
MNRISLILAVSASIALSACAFYPSADAQQASPWRGPVSIAGMDAFRQFMSSDPTPAQFREQYPDVQLVLPGDVTTKELRSDNSRYFAQLNQAGRIVSGKFM